MYMIYFSSMSTVEVKDISHSFKTQRYGFNSFSYKATHHWNLVDNCYKDPTGLANWQPLCGCATCDICMLRKV